MATQRISASVTTPAPPEIVWQVIADAPRYPEWSKLDRAGYERGGTPAPHGAGAIRVFGAGKVTLREEVTAFVPGRYLDYRLLSGIPIRDYTSRISIAPRADGGTAIHWGATFRPQWPGTGRFIASRLGASLVDLVTGLAREAERVEAVTRPAALAA